MADTYYYGTDAKTGKPVYESAKAGGIANPATAISSDALSPTKALQIPAPPPPTNYGPVVAGGNATIAANGPAITPTVDTTTANAQSDFEKMLSSIGAPPSASDLYAKDYAASGIDPAQADLNAKNAAVKAAQAKLAGVNARIAGITAEGQAMNLAQDGRQAPSSAIQGQQAENNRQTAIRALPEQVAALAAQAEVASAQGDAQLSQSILQQAQSHLDTIFKIHAQDAQNAYDYKKTVISAVYDFATKQEQAKLDALKTKAANDFTRETQQLSFAHDAQQAKLDAQLKQSDPLYQAQLAKARADAAAGTLTIANPTYAPIVSTILGSGKFTKDQAIAVAAGINSGENPLAVIRNQAKNIMGQTEATNVTKYESAKTAMENLQSALAEYYAKGGSSGIFTGNYETTLNKLGSVNNPALVDLATQIASQLQVYRNAVSGTAYSVQEGAEIGAVFPGINKSEGLNQAIISGRLKSFDSTINSTYGATLGTNAYNTVVAASGGKGAQDSKTFVENTLNAKGIGYNKFVSDAPAGKIPVIRNEDGQIGYILPGEYNTTTYTRV